MIKPAQIKQIKILCGRIGLADNTYRDMLRTGYGVDSCKKLNIQQANAVINQLKQLTESQKPWEYVTSLSDRVGMASPAQIRMLEAMWQQKSFVKNPTGRRVALCRFCEKITGLLLTKRDSQLVTAPEAKRYIEQLTAMDIRKVIKAVGNLRGYNENEKRNHG